MVCGTGLPLDMLTECSFDVRLVAATIAGSGLEPGDDVRVDPQRNLLLHRPVEDSAPGVGPIENLRNIGRVDLVVGQSLQRLNLRLCQHHAHRLHGQLVPISCLDVAHVQPKHWMRIIVLGIALAPGSALKQCARLNPLEIARSLPIGYSLPVCLRLSVEEVPIMLDNVHAKSGTRHFTVLETLGCLLKAPRQHLLFGCCINISDERRWRFNPVFNSGQS